jgi:Protein of unknown function (DUF5131)
MSDLFHEKVSFSYIERVFDVIKQAHHHTFQILTKRAERMAAFCRGRTVPRTPGSESASRTESTVFLRSTCCAGSTQRFDSSRSTLRLYRPRPVDCFERGQSVAISSKSLLGTGNDRSH